MAYYGTYFKDRLGDTVEVIISTDKNEPVFNLGGLPQEYNELILSGDDPVVIEQESDGLFSPVKSVGCTIKLASYTPMMELYNATNQSVSVKVIKNRHEENSRTLTRGFTDVLGDDNDDTSSTTTDTDTTSVVPAAEPTEYNYNDEIIFTEIGQTAKIVHFPALWVGIKYQYNPDDFYIDQNENLITLLRSDPGPVTVTYLKGMLPVTRSVVIDTDDSSTTTEEPTTTTTKIGNEPYVEATYGYELNINASAVVPTPKPQPEDDPSPFNPIHSYEVENIHNIDFGVTRVLFQGFVTPCEYSQEYNILDEIELECIDCISSLKNIPFDMPKDSVVNWIEIISTGISKTLGYSAFLLPTSYNKMDDIIYHSLNDLYQHTNLFYDKDDEDDTMTWYEVFEEFCRTFSLSLIPYDRRIIFLDYFNYKTEDNTEIQQYGLYTNQGMLNLGKYWGEINFEQHTVIETDNTGQLSEILHYAGEGGTMSLDEVCNKIIITSETKEIENTTFEDVIENDSDILSYCDSGYSKGRPTFEYPWDAGDTYWRQYQDALNKTINLYKFVLPKENSTVDIGQVVKWNLDSSTWEYTPTLMDPAAIRPAMDVNGKYWTFVPDNNTLFTDYRITESHSSPYVYYIYHLSGCEWSIPIQHMHYDYNESEQDYDVPSSINWDNLILVKSLFTGKQYTTPSYGTYDYRKFPMLYTTCIKTEQLTWDDYINTRIYIDGQVSRSRNPFIRTDYEAYYPAYSYTVPSTSGTITYKYDFVNMILYIEGDDGKFYYRTMITQTVDNRDYYVTGWEIRDEKIDFTDWTFEDQKKYICRIPLADSDDHKEGDFISFRNDVDYRWDFSGEVKGTLIDLPRQVYSGRIYLIPCGDFNSNTQLYDSGGYIWWKDIKIGLATRKDDNSDRKIKNTDIIYSQIINENYIEKKEVELKINTQQNNYPLSYSSIINKFDRKFNLDTKFFYLGSAEEYDIETILGNKYYTYYSNPRVLFSLPIQGEILVPFTKIYENNLDKYFMIDSYNYNVKMTWCDLNLVEIPTSVELDQTFKKINKAKD